MDVSPVHDYFAGLQSRIVAALEKLDRPFKRDPWQRPEGGGGLTCIVESGELFERGGVSLSRVQGPALPASASALRPQLAGRAYDAMGVSLVLHPRNPYCPTVHLHVRLISPKAENPAGWFVVGMDLPPYSGFNDAAPLFHAPCSHALAT